MCFLCGIPIPGGHFCVFLRCPRAFCRSQAEVGKHFVSLEPSGRCHLWNPRARIWASWRWHLFRRFKCHLEVRRFGSPRRHFMSLRDPLGHLWGPWGGCGRLEGFLGGLEEVLGRPWRFGDVLGRFDGVSGLFFEAKWNQIEAFHLDCQFCTVFFFRFCIRKSISDL